MPRESELRDHKGKRIQGFRIPPGQTIPEMIETQLRAEAKLCQKALKRYNKKQKDIDLRAALQRRGVVRGLAHALLMYRNPYLRDDVEEIKRIEREFGLG